MNNVNEVTACPAGCAPEITEKQNDKYTAFFSKRTCRGCSRKKTCPTKSRKRGRTLHYDDNAIRLARRRVYEESPEFRDRYRFRAGIEGAMSQFDRLTGIKNLRVRGMSAVGFAAYLKKATAINIIRAAAFRNRETDGKTAPLGAFFLLSCAIKEQLQRLFRCQQAVEQLQAFNMPLKAFYAA
jgi:hypothetical protein